MRFAISTVAGTALAACIFLGPARAEVFNFSYTFGNGGVASGVVEGIVQSDPNVVFLDSIDSLVALGETIVSPFITNVSGILPVVVTFDGSGNMDFTAADPSSTLGFQVLSSSAVAAAFASSAADIEVYDPSHWSLTAVVPEPSTWAMMLLGFAGLSFANYRRVRQPRST
jgi:hypothetical protein